MSASLNKVRDAEAGGALHARRWRKVMQFTRGAWLSPEVARCPARTFDRDRAGAGASHPALPGQAAGATIWYASEHVRCA